jgi:hypothetical protein
LGNGAWLEAKMALGHFHFGTQPELGANQMAGKTMNAYFRTAAREDILRQYSYTLLKNRRKQPPNDSLTPSNWQ